MNRAAFLKPVKPIKWRTVVMSYPCPVCTAGPGECCNTDRGNVKYEPHASRSRLARDNHWKVIEV